MAARSGSPGKKPAATGGRLTPYLAATPVRGATADTITDALREAILDGVIPSLSWLREEDLAAEVMASRTPVREALRRLTAEGLTIRTPNQGVQVAPMTMEDILAVYAVREILEGLAARIAATRCDGALVERLSDVHLRLAEAAAENDVRAVTQLNLEFHRVIRQATSNPYLERFLTLVEHSVRRFGDTTFRMQGRPEAVVLEHQPMVDAIVAGDADEAERCARAHMKHAREARISAFLTSTRKA
jgi:DNA-binding GntR family transcriptional regulator